MTRPRRTRLDDPTAENESDVIGGRNRAEDDDLFRRTGDQRYDTPRQYDQPVDETDERRRRKDEEDEP